jgi:NADH:ubiquinone oxidoreductase subunit 5 (subunit L)/multisubunit Na+/H+ antiporter MnhA subunit
MSSPRQSSAHAAMTIMTTMATTTRRSRTITAWRPGQKPHETPWVVTLPLILLAIPSVIIGYIAIEPMLFGDYFKGAIFVDSEAHPVMEELASTSTALSPWPRTR